MIENLKGIEIPIYEETGLVHCWNISDYGFHTLVSSELVVIQ